MAIDFNQLRELLAAIAENNIAELTLKSADFELTVRKNSTTVAAIDPALLVPTINPSTVVTPLAPVPESTATPSAPTPPPIDKKWVEITSPIVGTFYRSPAPDEPPFVSVGDRIRVGQTVCIIEAMKVMNEIEGEVSGQVMEILVENGQPVEYGQALMRINPE